MAEIDGPVRTTTIVVPSAGPKLPRRVKFRLKKSVGWWPSHDQFKGYEACMLHGYVLDAAQVCFQAASEVAQSGIECPLAGSPATRHEPTSRACVAWLLEWRHGPNGS